MIEKLYTVEEVAELASVTGRTIRNYLKSGRLVGRKIGGQWRFPETEVQRLLTGVEEDLEEESAEEKTATVAPAAPAWVPPAGLPIMEEPPLSNPINPVVSREIYLQEPQHTPVPLANQPASSGSPATTPLAAPLPVVPQAPTCPAPQPLPEPPLPLRPQPAAAPPPAYQQAAAAEPSPSQQFYFSGDISQEYSQAPAHPPAPAAYTPPPTAAPVYAAPITPLPEPEPPYQYKEVPAAVVQPTQPAAVVQQVQRPAFPHEAQPTPPAPQQQLYATYATPPQGGYTPPANQQGYQNLAMPTSYSNLYGQTVGLPVYPPMPQNYYGFAPAPPQEPTAPAKTEAPPPKQEAPPIKEPASAEASDYPPPTKRPTLSEEPILSDVGKRVSRFVSEVHDCSSGPLACSVLDIYMSLSSAKSTSEHLADLARQESEGGPLCQSFVEYDERYYVARFTLFGSSAFLFRCLQMIG